MIIRKTFSRRVFELLNGFFMLVIIFLCIAPVLHVFFASISSPDLLMKNTSLLLWPLGKPTLEGYHLVLKNPNIIIGYMNTLFYVVVGTAISVLCTAIGGYIASRNNFLLRDPLMIMFSITMLFNGGLVPTYMVVRNLGLIDTRWALIIPGAISVFNLIILRTFFQSIPGSLEESARIDGASDLTILFRIILPLSKAAIAVIALFYAVGQWNSWFGAMIYLKSRSKYPLQLILKEIVVQNDTTSNMTSIDAASNMDLYKQLVKYTTIMVATLPILCVYPFLQKYFVTGVMIGSIKG